MNRSILWERNANVREEAMGERRGRRISRVDARAKKGVFAPGLEGEPAEVFRVEALMRGRRAIVEVHDVDEGGNVGQKYERDEPWGPLARRRREEARRRGMHGGVVSRRRRALVVVVVVASASHLQGVARK